MIHPRTIAGPQSIRWCARKLQGLVSPADDSLQPEPGANSHGDRLDGLNGLDWTGVLDGIRAIMVRFACLVACALACSTLTYTQSSPMALLSIRLFWLHRGAEAEEVVRVRCHVQKYRRVYRRPCKMPPDLVSESRHKSRQESEECVHHLPQSFGGIMRSYGPSACRSDGKL